MGVGPPIIALYRQLKMLGAFEGINDVMEIGAQAVWCPKRQLVNSLFEAFDRPAPSHDMLERFANWKGSARELHEALGQNYRCVDLDPAFNSVRMDVNFDSIPDEEKGRYDLITNHGTSEHLINQLNFFKVMHEFARPGALLVHAVPFTVHVEHGFFNYQPNFFNALARYNSYETLGIWVGPDWKLASLIPWEHDLLDYLTLNAKTTNLLVVVHKKKFDAPFAVPFQEVYENLIPDDAYGRYSIVVDGETLDGQRVKYLQGLATAQAAAPPPPSPAAPPPPPAAPKISLDEVYGRDLVIELRKRIKRRLANFLG